MEIKFIKTRLVEGQLYSSEIVRYEIDEEQNIFKVYIVVDGVPELEFCKRYEYTVSIYSEFAQFCRDMHILKGDNIAELDKLINTRIYAAFRKGIKGSMFISQIFMDGDYFEEHKSDYYEI